VKNYSLYLTSLLFFGIFNCEINHKRGVVLAKPVVSRLCQIYGLCEQFQADGILSVTSAGISKHLGCGAHTVRKDFSFLKTDISSGAGYDVLKLQQAISTALQFNREKRSCIIGLGRLGEALMGYCAAYSPVFTVVAGFDANTNRLETINTKIPVFPAYELENIIAQKEIEFALLAIPESEVEEMVSTLNKTNIQGILNFTRALVNHQGKKVIRNIDLISEFRILMSQCHQTTL